MRRNGTVTLALVVAGLVGSACTAGGGGEGASSAPQTLDPSASHEPVTITIWSEWTDPRQTEQFESIFDGFTAQYPWITVKDVPGQDDDKILSAISGGNPPDAVLSFGLDNVAKFCESGAWVDLTPFIEPRRMELAQDAEAPAAHRFDAERGQASFERKERELENLAVTGVDDGFKRQRLRIGNTAKQARHHEPLWSLKGRTFGLSWKQVRQRAAAAGDDQQVVPRRQFLHIVDVQGPKDDRSSTPGEFLEQARPVETHVDDMRWRVQCARECNRSRTVDDDYELFKIGRVGVPEVDAERAFTRPGRSTAAHDVGDPRAQMLRRRLLRVDRCR